MNSRQKVLSIFLFLLIVFVGLAAPAGGSRLQSNPQEIRVGEPIPYTVTLREILHSPDGTAKITNEITQAVRSDGSRVWRFVSKGSSRTLNLSSGVQVDTNDLTKTKTSMMRADINPASLQRDPGSKCLNTFTGKPMGSTLETFLGAETVAGYRTAKIAPAKDSEAAITSWYALDYGCALVKQRWEFSTKEVSEKELVALVAGEPDATLFEVAADYREVPPSERYLGPKKECSGCDEQAKKLFQRMDDDYKRLAVKPQ
jgi:hypothetical protein